MQCIKKPEPRQAQFMSGPFRIRKIMATGPAPGKAMAVPGRFGIQECRGIPQAAPGSRRQPRTGEITTGAAGDHPGMAPGSDAGIGRVPCVRGESEAVG